MCRHRHITWPRSTRGPLTVECRDCLKRLPYDWQAMRIVKASWRLDWAYVRALRGFAK